MNKYIRKLFYIEQWSIGLCNVDFATILSSDLSQIDVQWLKTDNHDCEADPFLFTINEKYYVAHEVFDYLKINGKIKCSDLAGNDYNFFSEVNKVKGHKSFPYIFKSLDNKLCCIPETNDLKEVSLYVFCDKKQAFVKDTVLLNNDGYLDTHIYHHNDYYFLFTSTRNNPYEQQLFFSKSLRGPFERHPCSPIISDNKFGRNAGGIHQCEDSIYRLSQDCSETYGGNLNIHKIESLTIHDYKESLYKTIYPYSDECIGIHNLSSLGEYTVFDSKKYRFHPFTPFRKIFFKSILFLNKKTPFLNMEFKYY